MKVVSADDAQKFYEQMGGVLNKEGKMVFNLINDQDLGGIDFNPNKMNLEITNDGGEFEFNFMMAGKP